MIPMIEGAFGVALVGAAIVQANKQRTTTHWAHRFWTLSMGVGALWLVMSVVLSFAPVVQDASATVTNDGPGMVHVRMTARKVRDCRYIRTDAYVIDTAGNQQEATLTWEGDRMPGNSKPVGRHKWEPARVVFDADIRPAKVEFLAIHSCGWMWHDTVTTEGPWLVPH